MVRNVTLMNPSNTMPKDSVRRLVAPMGILYVASMIKNRYNVKILDSPFEGYKNTTLNGPYLTYGLKDKEIIKRIEQNQPEVVGITSMFSAQQKNVIHHCKLIKSVDKNIKIVLGGIHPSLFPKECIENDFVDFVIMGEGEYRFLNLLKGLDEGKNTFDFDGIAYKNKGKIHINAGFSRIDDLDALPFPARDLIDYDKYVEFGVPFAPFPRKNRVAHVMTSRGCPFNCVFCATVKYWGRKFRMRSVDNILAEIDMLKEKHNIEEIQFSDDNMTVNKKRARELFIRLKSCDIVWCTPHGLMLKTIDEELIDLMGKSGAYQVSVGIESGNERVRKEIIRKVVPPKDTVKRFVKRFHDNGVQVHGLFCTGFPGETKQEMMETFQYAYDVEFDSASFFIANPMPGSDLYNDCKEKGYLYYKATDGAMGMDLKSASIKIPKKSPLYVMSPEELTALVDDETRKLNEYSKRLHPERWDEKYKQFLKKHGDNADLILGRVT